MSGWGARAGREEAQDLEELVVPQDPEFLQLDHQSSEGFLGPPERAMVWVWRMSQRWPRGKNGECPG